MAEAPYEPKLPIPETPFSLTDEQRDTARLIGQILGRSISERYTDFCRLAYGTVPLRAPSPFAAHALRELDSSFRDALESLAGVKRQPTEDEQARLDNAKASLEALGFARDAIDQALRGIAKDTYRDAIRKIATWLGLDPDGDVAKAWIKFKDIHKKAHERKFNRSLAVDEDFRDSWARPFDMVARAVVVALEGKYASLMSKVSDLAKMTDAGAALTVFEKEIPGAPPLQWHFYNSIDGTIWLPELKRRGLISEPVIWAGDENEGRLYGEWPVGRYLAKMAEHSASEIRQQVIIALRGLSASRHSEVRRSGLDIISRLSAEEAATLVDVITGWLTKDAYLVSLTSTEILVKRLAEAGFKDEALKVATALFQVFDRNGETGSLYSLHMYEHGLPHIVPVLTKCCGLDALQLFVGLLYQSAVIDGKIETDPPKDYTSISSESLAEGEDGPYDIYGALVQAAKNSANELIQREEIDARTLMEILMSHPYRVFRRLAFHILAKRPEGAPEIADALLFSINDLEEYAFRHEYAELATARFPVMAKDGQDKLLALVDAVPGKYLEGYRKRFLEAEKREPSSDDLRAFVEITTRDITFYWRGVLPRGRQDTLMKIVQERGEPDAWRNRFNEPEISPRSAADFAASAVEETATYLKEWIPGDQPAKQTTTALGMELRNAVSAEPAKFSAGAFQFRDLPLLYIRRLIEGLRTPVQNGAQIEWRPVLELIQSFLPSVQPPDGMESSFSGDDPTGFWAAKEAGELIRTGLAKGDGGIPFECADILKSLLASFETASPLSPEHEHFEERYAEYPYFAAEQTMFGLTTEMFVRFLVWLSRQNQAPFFSVPREAISHDPEFQAFATRALTLTGDNGRIARAVFGRFLSVLYYFGEEWLMSNFARIFPDDPNLHECAWLGYLLNDRPSKDLVEVLKPYYREEIARLGENSSSEKREPRANRVSEYLMVLMLWGALPEELLLQFERQSPPKVRRHAMWFVGREILRPEIPEDVRERGIAYWDRRLAVAENAADKDQYIEELAVGGYWATDSVLDTRWLIQQFLRLLRNGLAPSAGFTLIEWLAKICSDFPDDATEILDRLISNPKTDRWATSGREAAVRKILSTAQSGGTAATLDRVNHVVGVLSARGDSSFLEFARRS